MEVKKHPENPGKPLCVLGVVDNEAGRAIADEMRRWLKPHYNLVEIWHDGSLYEQPAIRYVQDYCRATKQPCLYLHTKGAYNRPELSAWVRQIWKHEFTQNQEIYFGLVDRPYATVACPFTGSDKTTWYNGFVTNWKAMEEHPDIEPNKNRFAFERLFIKSRAQVIGVVRNDFHRELGQIDEKAKATWDQINA